MSHVHVNWTGTAALRARALLDIPNLFPHRRLWKLTRTRQQHSASPAFLVAKTSISVALATE